MPSRASAAIIKTPSTNRRLSTRTRLGPAVYENNAMQAGNIVNAVRAFDVNHASHGRQ